MPLAGACIARNYHYYILTLHSGVPMCCFIFYENCWKRTSFDWLNTTERIYLHAYTLNAQSIGLFICIQNEICFSPSLLLTCILCSSIA